MSNVWKGITDNAGWIKKGSATAIGNGMLTLFWDHNWAVGKPLRDYVTQPIPLDIEGATVNEMWDQEHEWKWHLFENLLPDNILKQIAAHKVFNNSDAGDSLFWQNSKNGLFSVKEAINLMRVVDDNSNDVSWSLAWKTPVQQRIRVFLWLTLHDRLLSNLNRRKRHLTTDASCPRCRGQEESLLHLLRDCTEVKRIWRSVGGLALQPSFGNGLLKEWITANLQAAEQWPTIFATSLWWIWRWRNSLVFGRKEDIPNKVGNFIRGHADITYKVFYDSYAHKNAKSQAFIRWVSPAADWFVLNSDGAAKGVPGYAGGGAVLRDCRGKFVRACAANFGICVAFRAELLALLHGIDLAQGQGIQKLQVQMDNMACVQALNNPDYQGGEYVQLIKQCQIKLKNSFPCFVIIHCFREANKVADKLANIGVSLSSKLIVYDVPCNDISGLLRDDLMGASTPRLV